MIADMLLLLTVKMWPVLALQGWKVHIHCVSRGGYYVIFGCFSNSKSYLFRCVSWKDYLLRFSEIIWGVSFTVHVERTVTSQRTVSLCSPLPVLWGSSWWCRELFRECSVCDGLWLLLLKRVFQQFKKKSFLESNVSKCSVHGLPHGGTLWRAWLSWHDHAQTYPQASSSFFHFAREVISLGVWGKVGRKVWFV